MTLAELIVMERKAVDVLRLGLTPAAKQKLYDKMRAFSERVQRAPLPNDVKPEDAWVQLRLRAEELARVDAPEGRWLPLSTHRRRNRRATKRAA